MTIDDLNRLSQEGALTEFLRCCGSSRWASKMTAHRPFRGLQELVNTSDVIWKSLLPEDWKEAFAHHPRIGDVSALRERFRPGSGWAANEQSGVRTASDEILRGLADGNRAYEKKFGYMFIVCATGKRGGEMLSLLQSRLRNDPEKEILIAAEEQRKIATIRLETLLSS